MFKLRSPPQEKKAKDSGKRMDVIQKPFSRKAEKSFGISKFQNSKFLAPVNPGNVDQTDRKVSKTERGKPNVVRYTGNVEETLFR